MSDVIVKSDTGRRPPILSAADNSAEYSDFLAYFDEQHARTPVEAAIAEGQRLSYYFEALDKRLTRGGPAAKGGAPKPFSVITFLTPPVLRDYKPRDVYQPGDLRGIFRNIAEQTRSIVLSEVMICPESVLSDPGLLARPYIHRGGAEPTFLKDHQGDRRSYNFGFLDVRHDNTSADADWRKYASDIALPVLALNDDMLKAIQPYQPQKLLRPLQDIITLCNHDMMHNMVNTISQGDISNPAEAHFKSEMKHFMEHKTGSYDADEALGFESALVVGHARTWQYLKDSPAGEKMAQSIENFYDHLAFIAAEMAKDSPSGPEDRHQVLDYFATAIPYALTRLVSLHDPLMERALQRGGDIAPVAAQPPPPAAHAADNSPAAQTLRNYRKAGAPLAEDETAPQNYREAKKLQLARILPEIALLLSPGRKGSAEYKAHARSDEMDRDIVNIIMGHVKKPPAY